MTSPCSDTATEPTPSAEPILPGIHSPQDLKALSAEQLPALAQEIREKLITTLSDTGGHLAPNLGLVEVSLALHRIFNTPQDKILFDVSHQAYIHKMMTGRADKMDSIRQFRGLSGFTKRSESEHDAFGAGHAGTALSAALGMAAARDLKGEDYHVVALVGDGSFGCGPSLEALNNVATTTKRLILILNDNEWSIDKNVGSLSRYFSSLQETETFTWLRDKGRSFVEKLAGKEARAQAGKLASAVQGLLTPHSLFTQLGFTYYGPVDGHDTARLEKLLRIASKLNEPVVLHLITEKGRGYEPAAKNPTKFHGIGSYKVEDGTTKAECTPTYSEVFGSTLSQLAEDDPAITAVTAAMPSGTKLNIFRERFPKRFYDVGIAEEHAAIFACGQASQGLKPYVAIYSTFMQRCVDMIQHDASLQKLPVRFCMDRAGLSPDDGPTHHGLFDIAMIRCIPDIIMMQPKDEAELAHMLFTMNSIEHCPSSIRYPRGTGEGVPLPAKDELQQLPIGQAEVISAEDSPSVTLLALGNMNNVAASVREQLASTGIKTSHINARFIKPLDESALAAAASKSRLIVTLEDHSITGGFGSAVMESLSAQGSGTPVLRIGWPDAYVEHGTLPLLRQKHGLTPAQIVASIQTKLNYIS